MTCLQVRSAPSEPFLSASIRGFTWELNHRYMIEAKLLPAVAPEDGDQAGNDRIACGENP